MSAKAKILTFIGSLFVATVVLLSLVGFFNFKSASVENYTHTLNTKTDLIAKSLETKMGTYFDALQLAAKELEIDEAGKINPEQVVPFLQAVMQQFKVLNVYVGLGSGDTYDSSTMGLIPNFNAKKLNREWYTRGFKGEHKIITKPYNSSTGAQR